MNYSLYKHSIAGVVFSVLTVFVFVIWIEIDKESLRIMVKEDGHIENLTAIFFGISCICFIVFAKRSEFLAKKGNWFYLITAFWALLMFIFVGEEISWGQRIFDIATPEALKEINKQGELNIHNIEIVDSFMGGKYRYLSIMMLSTGLLMPLLALTEKGRDIIKKIALPVAPLRYSPLFVGAYLYGKYYNQTLSNDAASEVRELLMAIAMLSFALHGAIQPEILFRINGRKNKN